MTSMYLMVLALVVSAVTQLSMGEAILPKLTDKGSVPVAEPEETDNVQYRGQRNAGYGWGGQDNYYSGYPQYSGYNYNNYNRYNPSSYRSGGYYQNPGYYNQYQGGGSWYPSTGYRGNYYTGGGGGLGYNNYNYQRYNSFGSGGGYYNPGFGGGYSQSYAAPISTSFRQGYY